MIGTVTLILLLTYVSLVISEAISENRGSPKTFGRRVGRWERKTQELDAAHREKVRALLRKRGVFVPEEL
jgi:hypothetical protein